MPIASSCTFVGINHIGLLELYHYVSRMYWSNQSFNIPSPVIPRAFDTFAVSGRREFDYQSLPVGGEFELSPRFHVKSLAWQTIMGDVNFKCVSSQISSI